MTKNIGAADRGVRLGLAVVLLALLFLMEGPLRWIGLVGFIFLLTAVVNWCPIYAMLGMQTCASNRPAA